METITVDFVLCENTTELFVAPGYSSLEEGDLVAIENSNAYFNVKKVVSLNTEYDKKEIAFMLAMNSKPSLRKITKKIVEKNIEYDESVISFIAKIQGTLINKENNNERTNK